MRFRSLSIVAASLFVLAPSLAPSAALAVEPRSAVEETSVSAENITDTAAAQKLVEDAVARYQKSAEEANARMVSSDMRYEVYTAVPGDDPDAVWIIPEGSDLPTVTLSEGKVSVRAAAPAPPSNTDVEDAFLRSQAVLETRVEQLPPNCYTRMTEHAGTGAQGWMDTCYQWSVVRSDNDNATDFFGFKQFATCKSLTSWRLAKCGIGSRQDVNGAGPLGLAWQDWAPRADTTGQCRSINLGVSIYGIGVSGNYNGCEQNDITKHSLPGDFDSAWVGSVYNSEREVAYQIAVADPAADGVGPQLYATWQQEYTLNIG